MSWVLYWVLGYRDEEDLGFILDDFIFYFEKQIYY